MTLCRPHDAPGGFRGLSFSKLGRTSLPGAMAGPAAGVGLGLQRKGIVEDLQKMAGFDAIIPARPAPWDRLLRRIGDASAHGKTRSVNNESKCADLGSSTSTRPVKPPMVAQKQARRRKPQPREPRKPSGLHPFPAKLTHDPTPRSLNKLQCRQDTHWVLEKPTENNSLEQRSSMPIWIMATSTLF